MSGESIAKGGVVLEYNEIIDKVCTATFKIFQNGEVEVIQYYGLFNNKKRIMKLPSLSALFDSVDWDAEEVSYRIEKPNDVK